VFGSIHVGAFGGVMVIVLSIRPEVRGFKPSRERWISKCDKIRSTIYFGAEVKSSVQRRKIYTTYYRTLGVSEEIPVGKIHFSPSFSLLRY
jgi:hypothetical protein